jgi:hypothetical protein
MNFNFFDYLNLTINTNGHRGYKKYFNNEYQRIANDSQLNPKSATVTVEIVDKLPIPNGNDIRRSINCKQLFTYQYLIRGVQTDQVHIYFKTHLIDKLYINAIGVFLQAQVLEPIMYLKLLERNVLFMHAGGVADEQYGYLLPAYGGAGKTTFSIALLNHGYKLLGDDLLFVALDEKKVYPYPRPMHLFTYNISNLNGASIPLKYKTAVYAKNVIRYFLEKILNVEFLISTRVHADEVFPDNPFGTAVPYKRIFFLKKGGPATTSKKITKQTVSDVAVEIMQSEDLNDSLYDILNSQESIDNVKRLELKVISNLLLQFDEITYINTRKLDLQNLQSFIKKNF